MSDIDIGIPQYPWDEGDVVYASALNAAFANGAAIGGPYAPYYVTATGSMTARSMQDRANDRVNVRDYGAVLDGTTNDYSALVAAHAVASADNAAVFVPRGGINVTGSTITGPTPVLWNFDGSTAGTGIVPITYFGDGDVVESFAGSKVFAKQIINSTNIYAVVQSMLSNAYPGFSTYGPVISNLLLNTTSQPTATGSTWGINSSLHTHAMGGYNTQDVSAASSVFKYGAATTWQYFGQTVDFTGLPAVSNGSIVGCEWDIGANGPEDPETAYQPGVGARTFLEINASVQQPAVWVANTAYTVGAAIQPPGGNGFTYVCTVAGTSAAYAPAWPASAGTVTDGTVTWKYGTSLPMQVSRGIALNSGGSGAEFGAGILANGYFYDAILECCTAVLVDGGVKDAAIRLRYDMPIDFSADGTSAGQNYRTLRWNSTSAALEYKVASSVVFAVDDVGTLLLAASGGWSASNLGKQLSLLGGSGSHPAIAIADVSNSNLIGLYNASGTFGIAAMPAYNDSSTAMVPLMTFSQTAITVGKQFSFSVLPLNAATDAAAAAAGVPLHGVYLNGNVIQIRLT